MLIWFAAGSVAVVWIIFQSPALDYRMVMAGALLGTVEIPFGAGPLQSVWVGVATLGLVMAVTVGRRLVRRRWLGIPIGMLFRLLLDGAFLNDHAFLWPIKGWAFEGEHPVLSRGVWSIVLELGGILLAVWCWDTFGLGDRDRRTRFVRTGQLDRNYVKPTSGTC